MVGFTENIGHVPYQRGRAYGRRDIALKSAAVIDSDLRRERKIRAKQTKLSKEEFRNMVLNEKRLA